MILDFITLPMYVDPGTRIVNQCVGTVASATGAYLKLRYGRDITVPPGLYKYKIVSGWYGVFYEHTVLSNVPINKDMIKRNATFPMGASLYPISVKVIAGLNPSCFLFVNGINYFLNQTIQAAPDGKNGVSISEALMRRVTALGYATHDLMQHYEQNKYRFSSLTPASVTNGMGLTEDLGYIHDDIGMFGEMIFEACGGPCHDTDVLELHNLAPSFIDPITAEFIHGNFNPGLLCKYRAATFDQGWFNLYDGKFDIPNLTSKQQMAEANQIGYLVDNIQDNMYTDIYFENFGTDKDSRMNMSSVYGGVTDCAQYGYVAQVSSMYDLQRRCGCVLRGFSMFKSWFDIIYLTLQHHDGKIEVLPVDLTWQNITSSAVMDLETIYNL